MTMERRGRAAARKIEAELQRAPAEAPPATGGWTPQPERLEKAPPRELGEKDAAYYMRVLPKPPRAAQTDEECCEWLDDVMYVGGPAALEWAWRQENWPLSKVLRGRNNHYYALLMRRAEADAQRRAEADARSRQEQAEDERMRRRRKAGWA